MQGWVATWNRTGRELNPPPVNRKSNALPLSHHANTNNLHPQSYKCIIIIIIIILDVGHNHQRLNWNVNGRSENATHGPEPFESDSAPNHRHLPVNHVIIAWSPELYFVAPIRAQFINKDFFLTGRVSELLTYSNRATYLVCADDAEMSYISRREKWSAIATLIYSIIFGWLSKHEDCRTGCVILTTGRSLKFRFHRRRFVCWLQTLRQ